MLLVYHEGEWKQFHELKSIPELGDSPNRIDATSLESETREYIAGLSDQGDFAFTLNAMPVNATESNVALVRSLSRTTVYPFKWKSPRLGIEMTWNAEFSYRFGAGVVDSVRDLIIALIPHSKPVESVIQSTYTLQYNANGGTGSVPQSQTGVANGTAVTVAQHGALTKTGASFGYWNTKADGTGASYDENDCITMYGDVTLYAIWSE